MSAPSPTKLLEFAQRYRRAGLCVVPVRLDGSKSPALESWSEYQSRLPTEDEVCLWFGRERGIAVVCGAVSGHLETLDFEDPGAFEDWEELVEAQAPGLAARLVVTRTPGKRRDEQGRPIPGRHVRYRVDVFPVPGSTKLARDEAGQVVIETRGEGSYALAPGGSPRAHPSGELYVPLRGDLAEIPEISAQERELLVSAARSLNRHVEPECHFVPREPGDEGVGDRPGDRFNAMGDWSFLLRHGWSLVSQNQRRARWRRPGKETPGISATTGFCRGQDGTERLYVFSTNAAPFEAERCYSPFAAYALLEHNGDFSAAAAALAAIDTGVTPDPRQSEQNFFRVSRVNRAQAQGDPEACPVGPGEEHWPAIIPLATMPVAPTFPVDVFPGGVADYVREVAEALGGPPDFAGLAVLAVAASEIGSTRSLFVKPGYWESARLYAMLVGGVGSSKTPSINIPAESLRRRHRLWQAQYDRQKDQYNLDLSAYEARKAEAAKKKETLAEPPPRKPVQRRPVVDNTTVERLAGLLADNLRGVALVRDELSGWYLAMNAYRGGRGDDRQFFLSCFSGETILVDRKNHLDGQPLYVRHPFLTILGGIQPAVLRELNQRQTCHDGLSERFLYAYPDEPPLGAFSEAGVSPAAEQQWSAFCDKLALLEGTTGPDGGRVPVACCFTPEGKEAWVSEYDSLLIRPTNQEDFPVALRAYASKLRAYAARLALILELMHDAAQGGSGHDVGITPETARRVGLLLTYFLAAYRRVLGGSAADDVSRRAARIVSWLTHKRPGSFRAYQLFDEVKKNQLFPDLGSLDAPLRRLCEHNFLRVNDPAYKGRGRPQVRVYEVHPDLLSGRHPENPENPEKGWRVTHEHP